MNLSKALFCLVALVFACAISVQADGPQPCTGMIMLADGVENECSSCCQAAGMVMGYGPKVCKCDAIQEDSRAGGKRRWWNKIGRK